MQGLSRFNDVQVEDVHDGVAHLVHSLGGVLDSSHDNFPEDVGAYHGDYFDGLSGMQMYYYSLLEILYCALSFARGG